MSSMSGRTFVDTNVLVYLYDRDEPDKRRKAWEVFDALVQRGDVVLSTQVLQEFYVTVTRRLATPIPPADALDIVRRLAEFQIVPADSERVVDAIEFSQRHEVSLWDALIIGAALQSGSEVLLTEDLHAGWVIGELRVESPFAG